MYSKLLKGEVKERKAMLLAKDVGNAPLVAYIEPEGEPFAYEPQKLSTRAAATLWLMLL